MAAVESPHDMAGWRGRKQGSFSCADRHAFSAAFRPVRDKFRPDTFVLRLTLRSPALCGLCPNAAVRPLGETQRVCMRDGSDISGTYMPTMFENVPTWPSGCIYCCAAVLHPTNHGCAWPIVSCVASVRCGWSTGGQPQSSREFFAVFKSVCSCAC